MNMFKKRIDEEALEVFLETLLDRAERWGKMGDGEKKHAIHWLKNYFKRVF